MKRLIKFLVLIILLLLVHIHAQSQGQDEPAKDDSLSVEHPEKHIIKDIRVVPDLLKFLPLKAK